MQLKMVYMTFVSTLVSTHLPVNVVVQAKCSFHPDCAAEGAYILQKVSNPLSPKFDC